MIFYIFISSFSGQFSLCSAYFKNGLFHPCITLSNLFLSRHGSSNKSRLPQCVTDFSLVWVIGKFCFASIIPLKTNYTFAPFSRVLEFFFDDHDKRTLRLRFRWVARGKLQNSDFQFLLDMKISLPLSLLLQHCSNCEENKSENQGLFLFSPAGFFLVWRTKYFIHNKKREPNTCLTSNILHFWS